MANLYILNADGSKTPATKDQVIALAQSGKLTLDTRLEVLGRVVPVSKVKELRQYFPTTPPPVQVPEFVSPGGSSASATSQSVEAQPGGAIAPIPNLARAGSVAPYAGAASSVCSNCGNAIPSDSQFCGICGAPNSSAAPVSVCPQCRSAITPGARFCSKCGASTIGTAAPQMSAPVIVNVAAVHPGAGAIQPGVGVVQPGAIATVKPKSKTTAGLLALLLGGAGIHKFYLGSWGWGLIYLVFIWTYVPALLGFIEGIMFLTMSEENFNVKYAPGTESAFKW